MVEIIFIVSLILFSITFLGNLIRKRRVKKISNLIRASLLKRALLVQIEAGNYFNDKWEISSNWNLIRTGGMFWLKYLSNKSEIIFVQYCLDYSVFGPDSQNVKLIHLKKLKNLLEKEIQNHQEERQVVFEE